jgi:2-keto-4-pentenoate hydratase/2-oxohepta-3-ene-1,7-dioic acid hydratase in catechol pathway
MKLATYTRDSLTSVGRVEADRLVELASVLPDGVCTMLDLLRAGPALLEYLEEVATASLPTVPLTSVHLLAPVPHPSKFLAIGLNYRAHLEEVLARGGKAPESQIWFNKQVSCVTGPYDPIHRPQVSDRLDYEGELGVVIGTRCRHVKPEQALKMVAGYVVMNDVSARDWQRKSPTWTLGKSFDTHGPMGPWLVTAREIADPQNLRLRLWVNGEIRQQFSTAGMIYPVAEQIAYLSTVMTLEPGDLLATGTCSGAGWGMDPPRFLEAGDVVRVEIGGIGYIENRVIEEPVAGGTSV